MRDPIVQRGHYALAPFLSLGPQGQALEPLGGVLEVLGQSACLSNELGLSTPVQHHVDETVGLLPEVARHLCKPLQCVLVY
jgi:hypothetical protein